MNQDVIKYCIDKHDVIINVSENWESFALENAWESEYEPNQVMGRSVWDFIENFETQYWFKLLFRRVRHAQACGSIPFRCDSPQERRYLELSLSPQEDGHIELSSSMIRTVPRKVYVALLDINMARNKDLIKICSMCKRLALPGNKWVEIENGMVELKLFEADEMPGITHGVCPDCYKVFRDQMAKIK